MAKEIQTTVRLTRDKECKHSVRFSTDQGLDKVAVTDTYVSRAVPGIETAKSVVVTVQVE